MKNIVLPLSHLTFAQKLELLEAVWTALAEDEEVLLSPDWHQQILDERRQAVEAGAAEFSDWEAAKRRIRNNIR